MKIGLIDVDSHNYPNIPLMKISAYHKKRGDSVEWYEPLLTGHCDRVYMSKVFSFTPDYQFVIDADEVIRGGSGYAIKMVDGRETYGEDKGLPYEIEHIYPDYSIYGITDTAYGFLSRGCPRGCPFCHVATKEGRKSYKVADLSEFWSGQPKIEICDPNILACKDWKDLLTQLAESNAEVNLNQGLDIRLMTEEKCEVLKKIKIDKVHFAWDNPKDDLYDKFKTFAEQYNGIKKDQHGRNGTVYVLTNFNSTMEENLERIYKLRELNYSPFVMIYDKQNAPIEIKKLQRWTNNKYIFWSCKRFEDYKNRKDEDDDTKLI